MRNAWTLGGSMLLVAVVLGIVTVAVAEAVDVQGTWDGTAKCTLYEQGFPPTTESGNVEIGVSQFTAGELAISTSFFGDFHAFESDDGVHTQKGLIGGASCPGTPVLAGFFGKVSQIQAGDGGSMVGDINGAFFGSPVKCHFTVKRTSDVDPGLSICP